MHKKCPLDKNYKMLFAHYLLYFTMTNYLTKEGLAELQSELKQIKEALLPQVLEAIEAARAQGDLRENADYEISLNKKEELETRIAQIEEILSNYKLIDTESSTAIGSKVQIGSTVKVQYLEDNSIFEVQIVGASEADALNFKISNESPLAKAILGKEVGSEVKVDVRLNDVSKTKKVKKVKILDIV